MANKKFWRTETVLAMMVLNPVLIISAIVFNPLVVGLLLLLAPKSIVALICTRFDELKGPSVLEVWKVPFTLCKWLRHLMPWYVKKRFLQQMPFDELSEDERLTYFYRIDKSKFDLLTDDEKEQIFFNCWHGKFLANKEIYLSLEEIGKIDKSVFINCSVSGDQAERDKRRIYWKRWSAQFCVEKCMELTSSQITYLSYYGTDLLMTYANKYSLGDEYLEKLFMERFQNKSLFGFFKEYFAKYTPSGKMIVRIAEIAKDYEEYRPLLLDIIEKYGCPKGIVSEMFKLMDTEERRALQYAMQVYSQKCLIADWGRKNYNFTDFCRQNQILPEAQVTMNLEQYEYFRESGQVLATEAICKILSTSSWEMAKAIFKNEKENGLNSEEAKAIVNSSTDLSLLLSEVRTKQIREEAKAQKDNQD